MRYIRQIYKDTALTEVDFSQHTLCQLKYDGIWCLADFKPDFTVSYYSRHGSLKRQEKTHHPFDCAIVGELMYGSEWSKEKDREGFFFAFDLIEQDGVSLKDKPYYIRAHRLCQLFKDNKLPPNVILAPVYQSHEAFDIWDSLVATGEYEGLVFRKLTSIWDEALLRAKFSITIDLYIKDFEEGKTGKNIGNLGALICTESPLGIGLEHTIGGGLTDKQRTHIWNNKDQYVGKCITVEAKKIFKSGLLRHPNFKCFHAEK